MPRIVHNALCLARIKGYGAGIRHARHGLKLTFAGFLDEISALCLLWRAKLLKK